ncbi:MAG: hypothetical protein AAF664_12240 [Planctomycetota bacterium]
MSEPEITSARCVKYELQITIDAKRETVWKALIEDTNAWWLPDFHMVDESSIVEFDTRPGGRGLVEYKDDGGFLIWYSIQLFQPKDFKIYLVGHVAPDWGGPSTSLLCLSITERDSGSVLKVSDAHHGRVDDAYISSLQNGWQRLFGDGLANFAQRQR